MHKFIRGVVLVLLFSCISSVAIAAQFGSSVGSERGSFSLTTGYSRVSADWDGDGAEFKDMTSREDRVSLQANLGLAKDWEIYLRGGLSIIEGKNVYELNGQIVSEDDFEDEVPFVAAGVNGKVFERGSLSAAVVLQATYFDTYEDTGLGNNTTIYNSAGIAVGAVTDAFMQIDKRFDLAAGLMLQSEFEGVKLYFGPQLFYSRADAVLLAIDDSNGENVGDDDPIREESVLGFTIGARWMVSDGIQLDIEVEKRSNSNIGCSLRFDY